MNNPVTIGNATLYQGDVMDCLAAMPDESVHCCVTSPPYWGLRDYGVSGMIGLEPTFQDWLDKMVTVCREIRRVLRSDGTFWLNCGDCYAQGKSGTFHPESCDAGDGVYGRRRRRMNGETGEELFEARAVPDSFKPKDLLMMPARLAIALQADGWWLRSEIIWAKPNPMPESVTDRPTSSHEKIYLLTKASRYFYDAEAVREEHDIRRAENYKNPAREREGFNIQRSGGDGMGYNPSGRNLRNVWTMATQPYPESHFATFPEELPRKCILAGTSERGVCERCGKPWVRVVELTDEYKALLKSDKAWKDDTGKPDGFTNLQPKNHASNVPVKNKTLGWQPSCDCKPFTPEMGGGGTSFKGHSGNFKADGSPISPAKQTTGWDSDCDCEHAGTVPATVLDPFAGACMTLLVALQLNRRAIGIELNPKYCEMGLRRIEAEARQEKLF